MAGRHPRRPILVRAPTGRRARGGGLPVHRERTSEPGPRQPRYTADTEAASRSGSFTT